MSKRGLIIGRIAVAALGLSTFAQLSFVSLAAEAAEYNVRVLDPLPQGFIRFHDVSVTEPRIPSLFGPNEKGELGGNGVDGGVSNTFALRWNSEGEVSVLDVPEGAIASFGYDLNRRGVIVGWYSLGIPIAALWGQRLSWFVKLSALAAMACRS